MSDSACDKSVATAHRGPKRIVQPVLGRGSRVGRSAIVGFMVASRKPSAVSRVASEVSQVASEVSQLAPAVSQVPLHRREEATSPLLMPTMRLAIVPLTRRHAGSTIALAVATAERLARATGFEGALATVDPTAVRFGRGFGFGRRGRAGLSLVGFEPVATCGDVAVLDADDAHAAALAATGRAPLVSVVTADDHLSSSLEELQPNALLLLADAETSESYLALAREDLASGRRRAIVLTARYTGAAPAFDGALALRVDQSAELRLRLGATPSAATRENADLIAGRVTAGGLRRETTASRAGRLDER